MPYDSTAGVFDVSCARAHYELLLSQKVYEKNTRETVAEMRASEKTVEGSMDVMQEESDEEETESMKPSRFTESTTLENEKRRFENEDKLFWDAYDYVTQQHNAAIKSNREEAYMSSVKKPENIEKALTRDHLNRSMLHVAVERSYKTLVKYLVDIGLNVNDREGCGLTPLSLAVLKKKQRSSGSFGPV